MRSVIPTRTGRAVMRFAVETVRGQPTWSLYNDHDDLIAWAGKAFADVATARAAAVAFKADAQAARYSSTEGDAGRWLWQAEHPVGVLAAVSGRDFKNSAEANAAWATVRDQAAQARDPNGAPPMSRKQRVVQIVGNTIVLVIVATAIFFASGAVREPDDGNADKNCAGAPDEDGLKAERIAMVKRQAEIRHSLRKAETALRRAQSVLPSGTTISPAVERAQRRVDRMTALANRWSGTPVVTIDTKAVTTLKLGRSQNPGVRSIKFSTDTPIPKPRLLYVTTGQFAPAAAGREYNKGLVTAWARLDRDRQHGVIFVCVSQAQRNLVDGGTFTGSIVFQDPRLQRLDLPVTMSMAYPDYQKVLAVGLLVCFLSSVYVYFLRRPDLPPLIVYGTRRTLTDEELEKEDRTLRLALRFWLGYWRFITYILGSLTVVAGTVAAAAVFKTQYLASEDWTPGFGTWATYASAVAAAFVAGGTAGKLAGNVYWEKKTSGDDV